MADVDLDSGIGTRRPFTLYLYNCADDKRTLSKKLTSIRPQIYGCFREPTDMTNPDILISDEINGHDVYSTFDRVNYLWIKELNRYYFINNKIFEYDRYFTIKCELDPLMTANAGIKNINCVVLRNEKNIGSLLPDNNYPIRSDKIVSTKKWGSMALSEYNYYVTVNGGYL